MAKRFDRLLDKATDPTLLEPNWMGILDCVDSVRSNETTPKIAIQSIMKRYHNDNPHVAYYALLVLEASVKNSGSEVHKVVATREVMEDLKHMAYDAKSDKVKEKILELIGSWAYAFKHCPEYKIIVDTHNLMQLEGFQFPQLDVSEAMFTGASAPQWVDGDNCLRCRVAFGVLTRKHHCRACGQIFCDKCSSKQIELPHIGIEREVRVCESCYDKYTKKALSAAAAPASSSVGDAASTPTSDRPPLHISAALDAQRGTGDKNAGKEMTSEERQKEVSRREQEELEMAMAISQSEAEEKERQRRLLLYNLYNGPEEASEPNDVLQYKGIADASAPHTNGNGYGATASKPADDVDSELARYLDRDYWQKRKSENKANRRKKSSSPSPSAPPASAMDSNDAAAICEEQPPTSAVQNGPTVVTNGLDRQPVLEADAAGTDAQAQHDDTDNFVETLKRQIEVFSNRIRSNQARGRSILNDSSIQGLFTRLTDMHAELLRRQNNCDDQRAHFETLQDRLAHIGDARQALDALREEHERERQMRLAEEQRRRQAAMLHQLDLMRQKKHEMLEQQRQAALARFQQQQMEINMRRYGVHPQQVQQSQQQQVYNGSTAQPTQEYYAAVQQQQQLPFGHPQSQQQQPMASLPPPYYTPPVAPVVGQPHNHQVHYAQSDTQYGQTVSSYGVAQQQHQQPQIQQQEVPNAQPQYASAASTAVQYAPQCQSQQQMQYAPMPQQQQHQPGVAAQQQPVAATQQQQTVAAAPQQPAATEPVVGELISFD